MENSCNIPERRTSGYALHHPQCPNHQRESKASDPSDAPAFTQSLELFQDWEQFCRVVITGYTLRNGTDVCRFNFPTGKPTEKCTESIVLLLREKWEITAIHYSDNDPTRAPTRATTKTKKKMQYDIIAYESRGSTNIHELKNIESLEEAQSSAKRLIEEAYRTGGLADIYDENRNIVTTVYSAESTV